MTAHPNAHILAQLAEIAKTNDKPWKRLETKDANGNWVACNFYASLLYPEAVFRITDTIDTLRAQLDKLTAENEQLREQRNRIGLYIDRALNGGKKDDHEAGLGGRMDAIRALRTQLAEAIDLLETMFSSYENGIACYEDPEDCSGFVGYAFKMDDLDFNACCDLLNRTRPRAAISAAKGESNG